MSEKGKGLAILLGMDKSKPGDGSEAVSEDEPNVALEDAGNNLITAFKEGDAAGVAQAVLDIVDAR